MTVQTPPSSSSQTPGASAERAAPTVVRAADSAEFLAMLPHIAGFTPRDSIVLVPFAERRTLGAMRIDLPPEAMAGAELSEFAATAVGRLCLVEHITRAAVVVYTDDPYRGRRGRIARAELVGEVLRRLDECALATVEALCVAADGWGSYLEPDGPYAGQPLDRIRPDDVPWPHSPDDPLRADQSDGCELPPSDLAEREQVARALARVVVFPEEPDFPEGIEEWLGEDTAALTPYDLAALVDLLDRPLTRDIALTQWCGGIDEGRSVRGWQLAWARGERRDPVGPFRLAGEGPPPDGDRLRRALALAMRAASVAPRARRTGPLAAAAWLSWALGRSTHAAHFVALVHEIDPHHGLADIVATMVAGGHLPAWVYDRPAPGPAPRSRAERRRAERLQGRRRGR